MSELKVFITNKSATCDVCRDELGRKAWITLEEGKALCLACADLERLVFLPSGSAALTRRTKKYSAVSAVVLRFSKPRRRYERQGILVEEAALDRAEAECLADEDARARRRERAAERRAELDAEFVERFAARVRELFPGAPAGRESEIAEHACLKYSGRVGRTAAAKDLEVDAVRLAVIAHVRHAETDYDRRLGQGVAREEARALVRHEIDRVLTLWETPSDE